MAKKKKLIEPPDIDRFFKSAKIEGYRTAKDQVWRFVPEKRSVALANLPERSPFLGLQIDDRRRRISRAGCKGTVNFEQKGRTWELFCVLHDALENGSSRKDLKKLFGGDDHFDQQKKKLSLLLRPLGLRIGIAFRGQWRIVEIGAATSKSCGKKSAEV